MTWLIKLQYLREVFDEEYTNKFYYYPQTLIMEAILDPHKKMHN